jgi:hypothetical protein
MPKIYISFIALLTIFLSGCSDSSDIETWQTNQDCNLHLEQCFINHNQQQITLSLKPSNPIPIAKKLDVKINLTGIKAKEVFLDIAGVSMYMGFNRVKLKKTAPNIYEGKTMLAFCTSSKMIWLISAIIKQENGKTIQAPFQLITSQ